MSPLSAGQLLRLKSAGTAPADTGRVAAAGAPADSSDLRAQAGAVATKYGLDPKVFVRLIEQESGFNPGAKSGKGAVGLGQLMPDTAAELGVDPSDPAQNLEGSARYLKQQLDRFGDYPRALAAYNAGPGNVRKYGGIPPFPETQNYVASISKDSTAAGGGGSPTPAFAPAGGLTAGNLLALQGGGARGVSQERGGEAALDDRGLGEKASDAIGGFLTDTVEGAVGPFSAAYETGQAILASPGVGLLPAEDQEEHLQKAADAAWKGAAFWGSMLVGGPIANLPMRTVVKMGLAGAASAATFEATRDLPDVMHKEMSFPEWVKNVATASTFGALTGGVLSTAGPKVAGLAAKGARMSSEAVMGAADRVVNALPGGAELRTKVAGFLRRTQAHLWHPTFTSGQEVLKKAGLGNLATQLVQTRAMGATLAGKYVAGFMRNIEGLSGDERMMMGKMLDTINFQDLANDGVAQRLLRAGSDRTRAIFQRAAAEADRLRMIGEEIQKSGLQTYHPDSGEFSQFKMRDKYLPHRFVNPEQFRADGPVKEKAIQAAERWQNLSRSDAEIWVSKFADRLEDENTNFLMDPTRFKTGSSHYRIGRFMELPGYETDVGKILPQYYDSVSRRTVSHAMFGPVNATETALQKALFQKGQLGERVAPMPGEENLLAATQAANVGDPAQLSMFSSEEMMAGRGMKRTPITPPKAETVEEILIQDKIANNIKAKQEFAMNQRYPRAFAQLATVEDDAMKRLSNTILRRQLGGIEATPFGEEALGMAAKLEVITKLALGAIAQPSQMLSGIVRTQWKGAFTNLLRTFSDPTAADFALRSGVILRSIVRESEQSLTGGETDFLKRVMFTQMDMKSRIFGALQGASHAEFQADKLASLMKMPQSGFNQRAIEKIEEKLVRMGLDPAAIVRRGGTLTEEEMLRAAQVVSMDVNFWGDSMALPAFFKSPYGKYITQFKSFGFQQSKLIKDTMVKPAVEWAQSGGKRGDLGPLARFALTMPIGGELITDFKKFARGRQRDDASVERVATNIANAAGFGLVYDAFDATKYGVSGSLGFIGGPILGTVAKAGTAIGSAVRGDPTKLERFAIETGLPAATALVFPGALPAVSTVAPALANKLTEAH